MHIAFAAIESPFDESQRGGIAAYLRTLIPKILQAGHEVSLFVNDRSRNSVFPDNSRLHVYPLSLPNFHWYLSRIPLLREILVHPVRQIEWSIGFYNAFKKNKVTPDVIECGELGGLCLHKIAPLIVRLHGSDFVFKKRLGEALSPGIFLDHAFEKKMYEKASALSAPSRAQAQTVSGDFPPAAAKMNVIANPVETNGFKNISGNRSAGTIFFNGRMAPVKGVEILLKAFKRVRTQIPSARLVLAGRWQMPFPPSFFGLELGETKNGVEWKGPLNAEEIKKLYGEASLFVMPSYYETFGISAVEAMASGLAVVASRAGALPEIIEDKVTGILVSPGNERELADAMTELLKQPDLLRKMGDAGRKRAEEKFDGSEAAAGALHLYQQIAGKK